MRAFEIQAHRGARAFYPENTLQAFCKAADLGCGVIELDLVVSLDRELVVSHDPWIVNCGHDGGEIRSPIYAMTYSEVSAFDCGTPSSSFPAQIPVKACRPRIQDVFMAVESHLAKIGGAPAMIYNIEVKSWPRKDGVFHPEPCSYAQLLNAAIEGSGLAARIRLQSFDYRIVRELWKLSPEWCYGLLVDDLAGIGASLKGLGFAPAFLNPHYTLVDESLVHSLHEQGLRVIPWTVNDIDDMLLMKHSGVDGIITDHPEVALNLPGLRDG